MSLLSRKVLHVALGTWLPAILEPILVRKVLRNYTPEEIIASVRPGRHDDLKVERHRRNRDWFAGINNSNSANRTLDLPAFAWFIFNNSEFLAAMHKPWQGLRYEEPVERVEIEWARWRTVERVSRRVLNKIQLQRDYAAVAKG